MDSFTLRLVMCCVALLAQCGVARAAWQPFGSGSERVDIDRSRIARVGDGLVTLWSRASMVTAVTDREGRYDSIEALNRYDCAGNRFATLKRLYLLDNTLVRVETVPFPRDMGAKPGSIDAAILDDICKSQVPPSAPAITTMSPFGFVAASESVPAKPSSAPAPAGPAATAAPPRFITLPRIDPSLVQHPTDEPKPVEVAKHAEAAVRTEAAKAGVALGKKPAAERHALEVALATSGPRMRRKAHEEIAESERKDIHWGYAGDGAPGKWGRLRPDYGLCDSGQRQSPIDIRDGIRVDLEPIKFDYQSSPFRIIDNGHTVQVSVGTGNSMSVMGRTWRLVQLHFHRPSEERIDGRGFEMVMHLVHKDDEGRLAVVAVLLERGVEHPVIQTFWNNLPLEADVELAPAGMVDVSKLLPEARNYFTYMGSLTTPPCSEGVLWMVLKQPLQISPEQIAIFSRLYPNNARPLQPANGRLIKDSR